MKIEITTNDTTKRRYIYQVQNFLKQSADIEDYIKNLDKKELSKFKNGLKLIDLENKEKYMQLCNNQFEKSNKFKKKSEEQLKVKTLENKINRLKSKRLKLGYRLQMISGLRVSEIADIEERDIIISENKDIKIHVRHGKNDKERWVHCFKDEYLLNQLMDLNPNKNNKLFCSKEYIIQQANKLSFHTHDLRKIYFNTFFYNCVEDRRKTIQLLKKNAGHSKKSRAYLYYLGRDINTYQSKIEKVKPFTENDLTIT